MGFSDGASHKEHPCQCGRHKRCRLSLSGENPLKESMETHTSILAWKIAWTEEPVGYSPLGGPGGPSGKEPTCQYRRCSFNPCLGKIPLEEEIAI